MSLHELPAKPWGVEQVAEYLGLSVQGVYFLVRNGELPARRIGRSLRFTYADLNRFLDGRRQGYGITKRRRPQRSATDHREPPTLLSTAQVADYLGLTENGVYYLVQEKRIVSHKIGRALRFTPAEVMAYLDRETAADHRAEPAKKVGRPRRTYTGVS